MTPDPVRAIDDAIHILNAARQRCFAESLHEGLSWEAGRFLLHAMCWLRPSPNYDVRPWRSGLWERLAEQERRAA